MNKKTMKRKVPEDPCSARSHLSGNGFNFAGNSGSISSKSCRIHINQTLNVSTWNVRTLYQSGKLENLKREMKSLKVNILGVSEVRWTEIGKLVDEETTFMYSGGLKHENGVGILLDKMTSKCLIGFSAISDRVIIAKLRGWPFNINVIQCYAPTSTHSDEEMEEFYEQLNVAKNLCKSQDIVIVMGDLNAKVGNEKKYDVVGPHGLGERNERGSQFIEWCESNDLMITNTWFKKHPRKLYTWKSPGDQIRNQIDYITINKRFRNSIQNVTTFPGADISSDHNPVVAKIKIKLKKIQKKSMDPVRDFKEFHKNKEMQKNFKAKFQSKYSKIGMKRKEKEQIQNPAKKFQASTRYEKDDNVEIGKRKVEDQISVTEKKLKLEIEKRKIEVETSNKTKKANLGPEPRIPFLENVTPSQNSLIPSPKRLKSSNPQILSNPKSLNSQNPQRLLFPTSKNCNPTPILDGVHNESADASNNKTSDSEEAIDVSEEWEKIKNALMEATKESIPEIRRRSRQKWMTEEILLLMDSRKGMKRQNKSEAYKIIDNEIKRKCKIAKEKWLNDQCKEIQELRYRDTPTMYQKIKQITGKKPRSSGNLKDENNKPVLDTEEKLQVWKRFTEQLFDEEEQPAQQQNVSPNENMGSPQDNDDGPIILKDEVRSAIKSIKCGKAPGNDKIRIEMIKALDECGIDLITKLANKIYETGNIPDEMKKSIFIPIPKKNGTMKCDEHRLISLISVISKIILKVLLKRARNKIQNEIAEVQFGFRAGKGTRNAIFTLRMLSERAIEVQRDLYICFVDFTKAFDKVKHKEMIKMLEKIKLDNKDIRVIKNLYKDQEAAIRVENELTEWIKIKRGVRQGCVWSPDLFSLYSENIIRNLEKEEGVLIGGFNLTNLRYADDTVLIADSEAKLQKLVSILNEESEAVGLSINKKKTKTLVISKKQITPSCKITVNGAEVKQLNCFEYLGSNITSDGRCVSEIKKRISIAKIKFNKMKGILSNSNISLKTRLNVLKTYIWSTMLYGAETWTISKLMEKRLQAAEMWFYRRMLRISWQDFKTNEEVLRIMKTERKLIGDIKVRQKRFLGHVLRQGGVEKMVLTGKINGKRARGQQRKTYIDNFTELEMNANSIVEATGNRTSWRIMVNQRSKRNKIIINE